MIARLLGGAAEKRAVSANLTAWAADVGGANVEKAAPLGLPSVLAAIGLRASIVAQLPWNALRQVGSFSQSVTPQPSLLVDPSQSVRSVWLTQMMISRDLWGNAFGLVTARDSLGVPTSIEWLRPWSIQTRQDRDAGPIQVFHSGAEVKSDDIVIVPSRIVLPGTSLGRPPLAQTGLVELGTAAQSWARDWFENGAVPSMLIKADAELGQAEAEAIAFRVRKAWRGRRPAVVGRGLSVEAIKQEVSSVSSDAAERAVAIGVCQSFGLDPAEIGAAAAGSSVTYANRTDARQSTLDRMAGELRMIEETFGRLLPSGQFVKFNTGAWMQSDIQSRWALWELGLKLGIIDVDWIRAKEDLPPMRSQP